MSLLDIGPNVTKIPIERNNGSSGLVTKIPIERVDKGKYFRAQLFFLLSTLKPVTFFEFLHAKQGYKL